MTGVCFAPRALMKPLCGVLAPLAPKGTIPVFEQGPSVIRRKRRPLSEYPLAMIEWIDASRIYDGWLDLKDIPGHGRTGVSPLDLLCPETVAGPSLSRRWPI